MKPVGPAHFYGPEFGVDYEFTSRPDGGMAVKITQGGQNTRRRPRRFVPDVPTTPKDLPQYAGVYWSEELETQYTLSVRDGKLVGVHAHHGEFELTPSTKDRFTTTLSIVGSYAEVKFVRDNAGRLTGATFGGDRVRQVDFVRR